MKITELQNFEELTPSITSTILGGVELVSTTLPPVVASLFAGQNLSSNAEATYTVSLEDGMLSDSLDVVEPPPPGATIGPAFTITGIFF